MENTVDIIIIGAGISGLSCAKELSKYSKNIHLTVLEASDRIGGRVKSMIASDGTVLELGAHFIHGTKKNPIFDFAVEKGLISPKADKAWKPYKILNCFHKEILSSCSLENRLRAIDIGVATTESIMNDQKKFSKDNLQKYKVLGHWIEENVQAKLDEYKTDEELSTALKSVFMFNNTAECYYSGSTTVYELGMEGYHCYVELDGDLSYVICDNGYSEIVDAIAADIVGDCIKFNQEVTQVERVFKDDKSKFKVATLNGMTYFADTVICTMSIEVLKHFTKTQAFLPPLPEEKTISINKLCLGLIAKIYFKFVKPIDSEYKHIRFYPSVKDFGKKVYGKLSQLLSFDRVFDSNWWLVWVMGDFVREFENCDRVTVFKNLIKEVKTAFPEFPKDEIDYDSVIASDWTTNPFYRGSYSFLKPDSSVEDIEMLGKPIVYGDTAHILFAGEVTHPQYYSTTHAAYLTGIREAKRVKEIYKFL